MKEIRSNQVDTCAECGECKNEALCKDVKKPLTKYHGIRFTADGYDCALPVSIDSHTQCSYSCLYCFSEFLEGHNIKEVKQYNLINLENILSGKSQSKFAKAVRIALKRDQKQPCPVQLGALSDPFDNIERNQGWALKLTPILKKYNQPCRISTKGKLFMIPEYLDAFSHPDLYWIAFSIITPDDELLKKIDKRAPDATERLKCMKLLSDRGVSTSLRLRPMIPYITDRTKNHAQAYKDLINRSADAGAKAISMEALFAPGVLNDQCKVRWDRLEKIIDYPIIKEYKRMSAKLGRCIRPPRPMVEDIFYACAELAKKNKMTVGVSDPVMKHLNDTGCCCGIQPGDPIFGNWQRENACQAVIDARNGKTVTCEKYIPPWSKYITLSQMAMYTGIHGLIASNLTWEEKMTNTWNDLKSDRGTLQYFQGILRPSGMDDKGRIKYKYKEPKRYNYKNQIFKV